MTGRVTALCMLAAAAVGVRAPEASLPVFVETLVALDTLVAGDSVVVDFAFSNRTPDTLRVEQVQSSCGCTVRFERLRAYAPGDTGSLSAVLVAEVLRGGPAQFSVRFSSSGDTSATGAEPAVLTVVAPVRREVQFVPSVLGVYHAERSQAAHAAGLLRNDSPGAVTVRELVLDTPTVLDVLTRQLPCTLRAGEELPFVVLLRGDVAPEAVNGVQARVRARTAGTRFDEYACDVYFFLE